MCKRLNLTQSRLAICQNWTLRFEGPCASTMSRLCTAVYGILAFWAQPPTYGHLTWNGLPRRRWPIWVPCFIHSTTGVMSCHDCSHHKVSAEIHGTQDWTWDLLHVKHYSTTSQCLSQNKSAQLYTNSDLQVLDNPTLVIDSTKFIKHFHH